MKRDNLRRSVIRVSRWMILVMLAVFALASLVSADELDDKVRQISDQLRCPTCQAMSVKDSEAGLSVNMKQKIRELLQEGKSEKEILAFFVDRYGDWILRSPKKKGVALFLWILPGAILILTFVVLVRYMRKRALKKDQLDLQPLSADESQKIDDALKNL